MNLNVEDINELIRQFLMLKVQNDEYLQEIRKLETIIDCQNEEIKTLKQILGVDKAKGNDE